MDEAGLAHDPPAHEPPGDLDPQAQGLQFLGLPVAILRQQLPRHHVAAKIIGKGNAILAQGAQLLPPLGDELVFVEGLIRVVHGNPYFLAGSCLGHN